MNAPADPNSLLWFFFCVAILMVGVAYWIPTALAFARQHPQRWLIFVLNLFLAGTGVIWALLIVWALWDQPKPEK
jgi:hypothetical protein